MVDIEILYRVQVLSIERIFDRMGPGFHFDFCPTHHLYLCGS